MGLIVARSNGAKLPGAEGLRRSAHDLIACLGIGSVGHCERVARGGDYDRRSRVQPRDCILGNVARGADPNPTGKHEEVLLGWRSAEHVVAETQR